MADTKSLKLSEQARTQPRKNGKFAERRHAGQPAASVAHPVDLESGSSAEPLIQRPLYASAMPQSRWKRVFGYEGAAERCRDEGDARERTQYFCEEGCKISLAAVKSGEISPAEAGAVVLAVERAALGHEWATGRVGGLSAAERIEQIAWPEMDQAVADWPAAGRPPYEHLFENIAENAVLITISEREQAVREAGCWVLNDDGTNGSSRETGRGFAYADADVGFKVTSIAKGNMLQPVGQRDDDELWRELVASEEAVHSVQAPSSIDGEGIMAVTFGRDSEGGLVVKAEVRATCRTRDVVEEFADTEPEAWAARYW